MAPPDVTPTVTAPFATSNYTAAGKNEVMLSASDFLSNEPLSKWQSPCSAGETLR